MQLLITDMETTSKRMLREVLALIQSHPTEGYREFLEELEEEIDVRLDAASQETPDEDVVDDDEVDAIEDDDLDVDEAEVAEED